MKSTIYSPNEQAFRNIDAELHALHQVEQSGVWRGNPTALRRLDDREAELCRSYIRLQCIIRHAAIPGDPWTNTMDNDVPVLPAVVAGVPRIAGRDDR
ncbi:hypothetical protein Bwad004_13590 [Bilophila wadsworthia]|jgi:hypothetical protein